MGGGEERGRECHRLGKGDEEGGRAKSDRSEEIEYGRDRLNLVITRARRCSITCTSCEAIVCTYSLDCSTSTRLFVY